MRLEDVMDNEHLTASLHPYILLRCDQGMLTNRLPQRTAEQLF